MKMINTRFKKGVTLAQKKKNEITEGCIEFFNIFIK